MWDEIKKPVFNNLNCLTLVVFLYSTHGKMG